MEIINGKKQLFLGKICGIGPGSESGACSIYGIRPGGSDAGDQRRTMTPAQAVRAGADYLVVGRPILQADAPARAAAAILEEMKAAPLPPSPAGTR